MAWSWAAGYIFTKLEGNYGSLTPGYQVYEPLRNMGNTSANNTADLYREITLDLPMTAKGYQKHQTFHTCSGRVLSVSERTNQLKPE